MARNIANGVQIAQQCWKALQRNPQLMIFPLLSGIALVLIAILFIIPTVAVLSLGGGEPTTENGLSTVEWILSVAMTFLYYFACYTVLIFSNTALVGVSLKLLNGESATFNDGVAIAMSRLSQIIGFALISATIGTLAKAGQQAGRDSDNVVVTVIASIVGGLIQGVWSVVVFFAIPVYVVENLGPIAAIRRSWDIFKHTWGEGFTGRAVIGIVSWLVQFLLLAVLAGLFAVAIAYASIPLIVLTVLFGIATFGALSLMTGAINGIFQASLYHYAVTGHAGRFIDNHLARNAFPT
ncbi:MAG: DUF6159 family protein [Elainellaceae cyanobacterium]